MAADRHTALLNEYEVCQASVESLEALVWQSAATIGLVSIGTLALVATSRSSIPTIIIVGAFSTAGTVLWWRLANRWWSVQRTKLQRMWDIEEDLNSPGQHHYATFLDELHRSRSAVADDSRVAELAKTHRIPFERARRLARLDYQRARPKEVIRYFPWATATAWLIYLTVEVISTMPAFLKIVVLPLTLRSLAGA